MPCSCPSGRALAQQPPQAHLFADVLVVGPQRRVELEGGLAQLVGVLQVMVQLGNTPQAPDSATKAAALGYSDLF